MILTLTYTHNEEREASLIHRFSRSMLPDAATFFSPVTAEQHEAAIRALYRVNESLDDNPPELLEMAKILLGVKE